MKSSAVEKLLDLKVEKKTKKETYLYVKVRRKQMLDT